MAQKQERLALSERERGRLKVLHEVTAGHLLQRQGAEQLGMCERGFRKLLKRFRRKGDKAVVHALRGKASNQRLSEKTARLAVAGASWCSGTQVFTPGWKSADRKGCT